MDIPYAHNANGLSLVNSFVNPAAVVMGVGCLGAFYQLCSTFIALPHDPPMERSAENRKGFALI